MTDADVRATVLRILGMIAPEADLASVNPDVSLRQQLDMDSMDFLTFLIAVDQELHVDIPETDYRRLTTINGCVGYLMSHLQGVNS